MTSNGYKHAFPKRMQSIPVIPSFLPPSPDILRVRQTIRAILSIADIYSLEIFEKACDKALKQYHTPYYKTIYVHAGSINSAKELTEFQENNQKSRIIRGANYY